jgi:hypothetical protein
LTDKPLNISNTIDDAEIIYIYVELHGTVTSKWPSQYMRCLSYLENKTSLYNEK